MAPTIIPSLPAAVIVSDPSADMAMNKFKIKCCIDTPNRQTFQTMHVRNSQNSSGKSNTHAYNAEAEAPPVHISTLSILPTAESKHEEEGRTLEVLQVGIIFADNPGAYSSVGKTSGRKAKDKEESGKVVERPGRVYCVVVPCTQNIASTYKLYVAITGAFGRYELRLTNIGEVFFFPEFWHGIDPKLNVKDCARLLSINVKTAAARVKAFEQPHQIDVVNSKHDERTLSNALSVTPQENFGNILACAYTSWNSNPEAGKPDLWLKHIVKKLSNAVPLLEDITTESYAAADIFFDEEEEFGEHHAADLIAGLKARYDSFPSMEAGMVAAVRGALVAQPKRIARLPKQSLALFLELASSKISTSLARDEMEARVADVLADVIVSTKYSYSTASKPNSVLPPADFVILGDAIGEVLADVVKYLRASAEALSTQHGGVKKISSLQECMRGVGAIIDEASIQKQVSQIFAMHGSQMGQANIKTADMLDELKLLIDEAIKGAKKQS